MGKIEGGVERNEDGILDLYLLPVSSGKLVLPRLLIDYKRGNWKESIFVNVAE